MIWRDIQPDEHLFHSIPVMKRVCCANVLLKLLTDSLSFWFVKGENEMKFENQMNGRCGKERNKGVPSLQALYERKHEEKEKARMEKEAIIAAKKEEQERAKARRNSTREKMFKRTQKGQPVMKYRIEHLLETIGASVNH